MKRSLYRVLIALHPTRFRERFGDEMLCIFDEAGSDWSARFFADTMLSLPRQWLLRSNLWKMASGAAISGLLLWAWGHSMTNDVNRWLNASVSETARPLDEAEFSREAAQAVIILAQIQKAAQKQHVQPQHSSRSSGAHPNGD